MIFVGFLFSSVMAEQSTFHVTLPSGRCATVSLPRRSKVVELKKAAQRIFKKGFLRLVADGQMLDTLSLFSSIEKTKLHDGAQLTAIVGAVSVVATSYAFALWCVGGTRW